VSGNINTGGLADISMSPQMATDEWRAVIKWDRRPSDLDTYGQWGGTKVSWMGRTRRAMGMKGVLEHDDTDGYGPETLYLSGVGRCRGPSFYCDIRYMINDYTESGRMKDISGAQVTLYNGDRVAGTWTIKGCPSTVSSDGNWWHVFTVDGARNRLKWNCNMGPEMVGEGGGALDLLHSHKNSTKLQKQGTVAASKAPLASRASSESKPVVHTNGADIVANKTSTNLVANKTSSASIVDSALNKPVTMSAGRGEKPAVFLQEEIMRFVRPRLRSQVGRV